MLVLTYDCPPLPIAYLLRPSPSLLLLFIFTLCRNKGVVYIVVLFHIYPLTYQLIENSNVSANCKIIRMFIVLAQFIVA